MRSFRLHDQLDAVLYQDWLSPDCADALYQDALLLPWHHDELMMFGKKIVTQRQVVWLGDPGTTYRYAGTTHHPVPWSALLSQITRRLNAEFDLNLNSALGNFYANGTQAMGYHQDNEPELGDAPVIASISLGAQREMLFKHEGTQHRIAVSLPHGSLLVMSGNSQTEWQHALPKRMKITTPRINFTFREIVRNEST